MDQFDLRPNRHNDVVIAGIGLDDQERRVLGRSLATFQVGESGDGEHLMAAADAAGVEPEYRDALGRFVAEEQEHARLLALVLDDIGQPLWTSHWTDRVFILLRRFRSLRTELLTLLVAEVVAIAYYGSLRDGLDERTLVDVAGRIAADERRHITFHAQTLPAQLWQFPTSVRLVVRAAWNVLVTGASVVVALDHGGALRLAGCRRRRFVADVWRERSDLDRHLFGARLGEWNFTTSQHLPVV